MDPWILLVSMTPLALLLAILGRAPGRRLRSDQALCDAASIGDIRWVRELLAAGVDPDSADEDGTTALMSAAFAAQVDAVRVLLDAGADPDAVDASDMTALMNAVIAAGEMDLDAAIPVFGGIIEQLLEAGADPGLEDQDGCMALDHARAYELEEIARLLEASERDRRR